MYNVNIIVIIVITLTRAKEDSLLSLVSKGECCDIDASCTAIRKKKEKRKNDFSSTILSLNN